MLYYSIMKQQQKPININKGVLPMYSKYMNELKKNINPFQDIIDMREASMDKLSLNIKHQLNRLNTNTLQFVACALTNDKDDKKRYNKCYPIKNDMKTPNKKALIDFITNQIITYNTTIRSK